MADSSNETEFNNNHDQNDAEVEVNEKTATKWKKRKNPSFTNEYFEKIIDPKTGDELRICKILDDDGNQCKKTYRNTGSSTGNLIQHLDLVHKIVSQENEKKKPRTTKITDYVKSTQPHPPHIQRQREEGLLKWMLRTNQPLSAVTNEAYKEMMNIFDSSFIIPGEKKIRTMIGKSYNHNQRNCHNLFDETAQNISLTTDFWSSRAKHGYLGVTATWITPDLKIKDVMLEINYIPSPHTAVVIADSLHKIISDWKLEDRISSITTDNGANMVASIPFLKIKPGCSDILHLPCTAHTLQLAIIKGLAPVEVLVARVRRLVRFFVTQKQVERLTAVQKKLGYNEVLHLIQDVPTRWNSTYYAWDRIYFLKDAIIQLQTDLITSSIREEKNDGAKLKKIMLSDPEWELIDQLVTLLMPFEEETRKFSGGTYVTLSRMISTIKELIFDLAGDFPSDNTTNLSYEDNEEVNTFPIETNDEEVISDFTNKKISIKEPLNTTGVLNKVQNNIYNTLIFYWNIPNELGLMAALLDPRYKNLDFVEDEDERQQIIQKLRDEYNKINNETANSQEEIQLEPVSPEEGSSRSYKKYQQLRLMKYKNKQQVLNDESTAKVDKIAEYLAMPLAMETEDPLEWWKARVQIFPNLSKLSRKYLAIPATSVSSERLFSDAGNLINAQRTRLNTNLVGKMLFLKRNMNVMNVFAPNWNEE